MGILWGAYVKQNIGDNVDINPHYPHYFASNTNPVIFLYISLKFRTDCLGSLWFMCICFEERIERKLCLKSAKTKDVKRLIYWCFNYQIPIWQNRITWEIFRLCHLAMKLWKKKNLPTCVFGLFQTVLLITAKNKTKQTKTACDNITNERFMDVWLHV